MQLLLLLLALNLNFIHPTSGLLGPIYTAKINSSMNQTTAITHVTLPTYPSSTGFFGYLQYNYDNEETTKISHLLEDVEFEPVNPIKEKEKVVVEETINCEQFAQYALNCTYESAMLYNSTKKAPPMPAKIYDWCKAIRHLTNCAIDWNSECKYVTESHFNEESIKGHMHVVNNICDDEWFISHYDDLPTCIDKATDAWETCYAAFKETVDKEKNRTQEWTHFETHFYLCCSRARFRHCTLSALFKKADSMCEHNQAVVLQKFSVIVSEGDVFQDCDHNMVYANCPGGDPRPSADLLKLGLMESGAKMRSAESKLTGQRYTLVVLIVLLCF